MKRITGLIISEPQIISVNKSFDSYALQLDLMTQGMKQTLKTSVVNSEGIIAAIESKVKPGRLVEFGLTAAGEIVVAKNPADTFNVLFARDLRTSSDPLFKECPFIFDPKDYGVELSNGILAAAGWVTGKGSDTITIGDGNTFSEDYTVSDKVQVYEIDGSNYNNSRVSMLDAVPVSSTDTRKQVYLIFDQDYSNSKSAKVIEIYYFAIDVTMPTDRSIMSAPWEYGHGPFNLLGEVYCVGDKNAELYLFNTSQGLVLLDTGWSSSAYQYYINIQKLGFDPRNLAYILLSHAHLDHFGTINQFVKMNGKVKVLMSQADYPYLISQKTDIRIDGFYKYGEYLDFGNIKLRPIFTPGHTPGATSFIFEIPYRGRIYKAGYMGGFGHNGLTSDDLKNSSDPATVLKRRRQFRDSLMNLQQNETVDFVAPQHINHYPILDKLAAGVTGVNPFVDLDNTDVSQFVKQMERRIEVIKSIIAVNGPKSAPLTGVAGFIVSEPKVIPGWGSEITYRELNKAPCIYFVQANIITDYNNENRILRTTAVKTLDDALVIKSQIRLGDYVKFDLNTEEDIVVAAVPEKTFTVLAEESIGT
jgi:hypothetical protein